MLVIFILSSLVHNFSPTLLKYRIFYETHYRKYLVSSCKIFTEVRAAGNVLKLTVSRREKSPLYTSQSCSVEWAESIFSFFEIS